MIVGEVCHLRLREAKRTRNEWIRQVRRITCPPFKHFDLPRQPSRAQSYCKREAFSSRGPVNFHL